MKDPRIQFLIERDGLAAARGWARQTTLLYMAAVADPEKYSAHHKRRMREHMACYNDFLMERR